MLFCIFWISFLNLLFKVAFIQDEFIQIRVSAEVLDPHNGQLTLTNVFHYTFSLKDGHPPKIIPKSYHESMLYLNGRRHFQSFVRALELEGQTSHKKFRD